MIFIIHFCISSFDIHGHLDVHSRLLVGVRIAGVQVVVGHLDVHGRRLVGVQVVVVHRAEVVGKG
jgi:hypothetical protein